MSYKSQTSSTKLPNFYKKRNYKHATDMPLLSRVAHVLFIAQRFIQF